VSEDGEDYETCDSGMSSDEEEEDKFEEVSDTIDMHSEVASVSQRWWWHFNHTIFKYYFV